ncbi:universal stress protein UspA [Halodesulfurarchaeum formicicum]|uniref:Universal stress protein UspA n=1 Tax=Halodesulfurarchaeum formicicum TaxID=1873524 RepID=A0A1D8S1J6_9EURY|nr:universal stress protein [Halodesulfurarchaeum formicicum]AOW79228.1 universal stress protein UspA [Halodesulfurarchaeum formicicum]
MYQDILFPTDGSEGTDQLAAHVGSLAEQYDATVHVVSVLDTRNRFEGPNMGLGESVWSETERERAETVVEEATAQLPADCSVDRYVESGVPHKVILEHADRADVDLIVMGTHGRTGIDHYLLGSVAEKVVRHATAPVLTVRI